MSYYAEWQGGFFHLPFLITRADDLHASSKRTKSIIHRSDIVALPGFLFQ